MDPKILLRVRELARQYAEEALESPGLVDYMAFENAVLQGLNLGMEYAKEILRSKV